MKKVICLILAVGILCAFFGFGAKANAEENAPAEEKAAVIYEAIFLDNEEILNLFCQVRGEDAPHGIMTKDFHVTTAFLPEQAMREYYGTEVTVRIYAYQDGQIVADDGSLTANEGFFCTIETENEALQNYIDHLENNWHITGSYQTQGGAKYTGQLDLTDAQPAAYTVTGHFGAFQSDNTVTFEREI